MKIQLLTALAIGLFLGMIICFFAGIGIWFVSQGTIFKTFLASLSIDVVGLIYGVLAKKLMDYVEKLKNKNI